MKLTVHYRDGKPDEIWFSNNVDGLMKFHMDGSTAVVDPEWDELHHRHLKDGFDPFVTTEEVVEEVRNLPFVQAVESDP